MNQFDYITNYYGKQFSRGQRVNALGKPGVVTGADHHVHVRLDTLKHSNPYHPDDVEPEVSNGTA